jgi:FAD/FMN-containing dehydrogenase
MDVLTGSGDVVTTKPGDELFDAFPNSYGSLGYAVRLAIELERVPAYVALRHVRFDSAEDLAEAVARVVAERTWEGEVVDALDGVAFAPGDLRLTMARWTSESGPTSDYAGRQVYWRSVHERTTDRLTMHDYLWRWDTDWFWCSRAFGAQHPLVRRAWPRRLRRSDVYWRLVALDRRWHVADRLDRRAGRPQAERVVQDVEIPVERLAEFLTWFDAEVGMRPVWLCPLRLRRQDAERPWPTYPLTRGTTYVNVGFWGNVPVGPEAAQWPRNRAIERRVTELGGHKSLYSDAFYDRETFDALYDGAHLAEVKRRHDPDGRLTGLYEKAVGRR